MRITARNGRAAGAFSPTTGCASHQSCAITACSTARKRRNSFLTSSADRVTLAANGGAMITEKIKVRVTESGQAMEVVVYDKRASGIQVVLGEGVHSVKCELTPTHTGLAYVGSVMGGRLSTSAAANRCRPTSTASTRTCANSSVDDLYPATP